MQTTDSTNHDIATAAYYQWVNAGCPAGRDQEFWLKAETELKQNGQLDASPEAKASTSSKRSAARAQRTR
jgi:hypothetical protein